MSLDTLGARPVDGGVRFAVWSHHAALVEVCLFDPTGTREIARFPLERDEHGVHAAHVETAAEGSLYGFRASGPFAPERGLRFDPGKLLVDPYALALDRPFRHDPRLALFGAETADLVPKAIVTDLTGEEADLAQPLFAPGGLVYEVPVKPFTIRHPDVPAKLRGTVAALREPAVIAHLAALGVTAVELMPITAWIDERHLPPLGLVNGWGYNPIAFMAPDPRLAPGGILELRDTVAALHDAGIGVILDVVFNHTGESDAQGATLCLRGLDNAAYYRHAANDPGRLVNDTGCGNTLACDRPVVRRLILDTLRHFVRFAGVDGFRFDLAPILGRDADGFSADALLFEEMASDPLLSARIMIAEPWDVGPGGYRLGEFPSQFLEWNDRYRDDVRRFWRGDPYTTGALATRLAGSADIFQRRGGAESRTVNFIAAHDGFTLADLVAHLERHNEANGEENRDGHGENFSWNNGVEGASDDPLILDARRRDAMALIATLFASRGTIMLTAGDEFGRTQRGNNNAYAQDNEITWIDWETRDRALENHTRAWSAWRRRYPALGDPHFLSGTEGPGGGAPDVEWLAPEGNPLSVQAWEAAGTDALAMVLAERGAAGGRIAVLFNRSREPVSFRLPALPAGLNWEPLEVGPKPVPEANEGIAVPARSVLLAVATGKAPG